MREIEFRGKRTDNGEWVYGSLISKYDADACIPCTYYIIETTSFSRDVYNDKSLYDVVNYGDYYEVNEDTICQYTGIKDKNGTKIFEGDIVKILYTDWASKSDNDTRTLEEYLDSLTKVGIVCWDNLSLCYHLKMKNECFGSIHCGKYGYIEVIGNICDNSELLEVCNAIKRLSTANN